MCENGGFVGILCFFFLFFSFFWIEALTWKMFGYFVFCSFLMYSRDALIPPPLCFKDEVEVFFIPIDTRPRNPSAFTMTL